jgi:hypothetical protein
MSIFGNIFGPGQNEVWGSLASDLKCEFTPSGWFQRGRIDLLRDGIFITLDTYTVSNGKSSTVYTRMRSPFYNHNNYEMNIYRKGFFSDVGIVLGMQNNIIDDYEFSDSFVIQGNPENMVKQFLSDNKIRELINHQKSIQLKIKVNSGLIWKQYPERVDELYFQCKGVIKEYDRLKHLFQLFITSIDTLEKINNELKFKLYIKPK